MNYWCSRQDSRNCHGKVPIVPKSIPGPYLSIAWSIYTRTWASENKPRRIALHIAWVVGYFRWSESITLGWSEPTEYCRLFVSLELAGAAHRPLSACWLQFAVLG